VIPGRGGSATRRTSRTIATWSRSFATGCALIAQGMTLEQVQPRGRPRDYDGIYDGGAGWTAQMFVAAIYRDLSGGGR
jgi:hypothetical protein